MAVAAQLAARSRLPRRGSVSPSTAGVLLGAPVLQQQFGTALRLVVQIAWGANLAADQSTWVWTDVTSDVQYQQKIAIKLGRADESSTPQPATIQLTVRNDTGKYSKGPQSANWPNVKKGTPLRVVFVYQDVQYVRAQGQIISYTPDWDTTGNYSVVHLEADGVKRRLNQGAEALQSCLTRSIPTLPQLVAYWPCEDGSTTGQLLSALPGRAPLAISGGQPQLASYNGFPGSSSIPTLSTDTWSASIPAYQTVDSGQIRFLLNTPAAGMPDQTRIIRLTTSGTIAAVELRYAGTPSSGGLRMICFDNAGNILDDTGTVIFNVNGAQNRFSLSWSPSGLNMNVTMATLAVGAVNGGFTTRNILNASLVSVSNVAFAPDGTLSGCSIGQIYVQGLEDSIFNLQSQLNAFNGETPTARLIRLCAEQGEHITISGGFNQPNMGPQTTDSFINLLEACAVVDQGYLVDGISQGLTYFSRSALENQILGLALAANLGQIEQPVSPVDDDQRTVNTATASRTNGGTVTYSDTTGPLSVAAIGTYPTSVSSNAEYDASLLDLASWRVHLGNIDQYRYAQLNLALHHHPELLPQWLNLSNVLAGRVEVTGLSSVRSQQDIDTVRLFAEGWTETIDQFTWTVQMNCSHWEPWRIITLAADVGDTSSTLCRLDTDGSTTVGDTPAGSTSVVVDTPSGPIWIEGNGDDFPLDVDLNGRQTTVTSIADGLANTGFESGISPWTPAGGTAVQSSTQKHSGSFSAQLTPNGLSSVVQLFSEAHPVVGGRQYTATAWMWFTAAVTNAAQLLIAWYDANSNFISATGTPGLSIAAQWWTELTAIVTAPANAALAQVVPELGGTPPSSNIFYVDDVRWSIPQTFSLASPTSLDVPAGSPVSVWLPTYLTMG